MLKFPFLMSYRKFFTTFAVSFFFLSISSFVYSLPEGENVVSGEATFDRSQTNTLNIITPSEKLIVNYNSFSIARSERVNFHQPSSSAVALNRVVGVEPSRIFGSLTANGRIFLVNPNGVLFGPNSRVDVAVLVASTLDISNEDFLKGRYNFFKNSKNTFIINEGEITVRNGGYVCLLSGAVENKGSIQAKLGTVVLASGEKIALALDDLGEISVVINEGVKDKILGPEGQKLDSAIKNTGTISVNGGKVVLTARVLNDVFDYAVNNSGIVEAKSLVNHNGVVELIAEGAPVINRGRIEAGEVKIDVKEADFVNEGKIITNGSQNLPDAGNISVEAVNILHRGVISADAYNGGDAGEIEIISANSTILDENSTTSSACPYAVGNGGRIYINSKEGSSFVKKNALIDVSAGSVQGNGGFIEISAFDHLGFYGVLNGRAPPGYEGATIIFDPDEFTGSFNVPAGSTVTVWATENIYISGNITLETDTLLNLFADHKSETPNDWDDGTGAIVNQGGLYTISAADSATDTSLNLKAGSGIGTAVHPIKIDIHNLSAEIKPNSSGDIYISQGSRDLTISSIIAKKSDVILKAGGDIVDTTDNESYIWAKRLIITEVQDIGSSEKELDTRLRYLQIDNAEGDIYIKETDGALQLRDIKTTGGVIDITVPGNLTLLSNYTVQTEGAGKSITLQAGGDITQRQSIITNNGDITLEAEGDIRLTLLKATLADNPSSESGDVYVTSTNGSILDNDGGDAPGDYDIIARDIILNVGSSGMIGQAGVGNEIDLQYSGTLMENVLPVISADLTSDRPPGEWVKNKSNDNTIEVFWKEAGDPNYYTGSGIAGYYYLWDNSKTASLDGSNANFTNSLSLTSPELADGNNHYFHIAAVDNAGNISENYHFGPFFIDTTPPTITAGEPRGTEGNNGWYKSDVTVSFTAADNLSGFDKQGTLTIALSDKTTSGEGDNLIVTSDTITDMAGNQAQAITSGPYKVDKTPPQITASINPESPDGANGWYKSKPTVSYTVIEEGSGIDDVNSDCADDVLSDGKDQTATGYVQDMAGWYAEATVTDIDVDTTPPTITITRIPQPNEAGWNNEDVTVEFRPEDVTSGIATEAGDTLVVFTTEGVNQEATYTATDLAGNTASVTEVVNIDKTPPTVTITAPAAGNYNIPQTLTYTVSDNLDPSPSVSGPGSGTVYSSGSHSILITALDLAGNTSSTSVSFTIVPLTTLLNQVANSLVPRLLLPDATQLETYRVNLFNPVGRVYFYHPLTEIDTSFFDELELDEEDYEFIDNTISIIGREELLPFLSR